MIVVDAFTPPFGMACSSPFVVEAILRPMFADLPFLIGVATDLSTPRPRRRS